MLTQIGADTGLHPGADQAGSSCPELRGTQGPNQSRGGGPGLWRTLVLAL